MSKRYIISCVVVALISLGIMYVLSTGSSSGSDASQDYSAPATNSAPPPSDGGMKF